MNKKGIFVSAVAILSLLVILMLFRLRGEESVQRSRLDAEYLKHRIVTDYLNDVESTYMPSFIAAGQKFALRGLSEHVYNGNVIGPLPGSVQQVMTTARYGGTILINPAFTISAMLNTTADIIATPLNITHFQFDVLTVTQPDPWTIDMTSSVEFVVRAGDITWNTSRVYATSMIVNGMMHPPTNLRIRQRYWEINTSVPCVLRTLTHSYNCGGVPGICPRFGCW
jgi:hypothetical protein